MLTPEMIEVYKKQNPAKYELKKESFAEALMKQEAQGEGEVILAKAPKVIKKVAKKATKKAPKGIIEKIINVIK